MTQAVKDKYGEKDEQALTNSWDKMQEKVCRQQECIFNLDVNYLCQYCFKIVSLFKF